MVVAIVIVGVLAIGYWLFMSPTSQAFGRFPYHVKTTEKLVALTFDDGPNEPYTSQILDYLDSKNIKATFFSVGKCIERFPKTTQRAFSSGHVIGNHSYSHQFTKYFSQPGFASEIDITQATIKQTIGKTPALFRPPWLWRQPLLLKAASDRHLQVVSGIFGHELEVFQPSATKIASRVIKKVKPGSIIIFHDGFDARGGERIQTVEAIKIVVDKLQKSGYQFVTVDKLFDIKAYQD